MPPKDLRAVIIWTEYLLYRARVRGFDLEQLEMVLKHSGERYLDTETGRLIAVGRVNDTLTLVAYETENSDMIPVTVHAVSRKQIRYRLRTGRFIHAET